MKIEKIRNNHKKEIIIGTILTVVIGGALTYKLAYSKYRTTQSIDLASGVINYTVPDFKIMAMYKSDDGTNYSEITDRMPSTGYIINTNKSYCTLDNVNHDTEAELKTVNGNHIFNNLTKSDKCYLYFDKVKITNVDSLIANLTINNYSPTFSKIATTDEGIFQTSDGMYGGTTYYWRGAVINNYVKFAGYCWRIIRINGDKTIRLIYDGSTCHANGITGQTNTNSIAVTSQTYNPTYNASYYVGWTYSSSQRPSETNNDGSVGDPINAKTQTDSWYNSHIENNATYAEKIADGKYCNDRNVDTPPSSFGWGTDYTTTWGATGTSFAYAGAKRLYESYSPTFNCPSGDVYTLKVGLITADEVEFAGGKNENNTSYYLYNGQNYWTMSPYHWNGTHARMFFVHSSGYLSNDDADWTGLGLRPVINLKADTTFATGGTGTQNNPYVVQ